MARIKYVDRNFSEASLAVIWQADEIIGAYQEAGYRLTLRQLYYQFVARGLLPNKDTEYKRLGSIINDARLAGLIDWLALEDRTRELESNPHWNGVGHIIDSCAQQYRIDLWKRQPTRVEVWIEKEALAGVVDRICTDLDVPYLSCRGYLSQSEAWVAGQRFLRYEDAGQQVVVLHLGDHDPSGIDMTRDNAARLATFGCDAEVRRIALNMDQIEALRPPPNPAKITDSRATGYIDRFGRSSWELDALDPQAIADLIERNVAELRDVALWNEDVQEQDDGRQRLEDIAAREEGGG